MKTPWPTGRKRLLKPKKAKENILDSTPPSSSSWDAIIIGAGVSGLTLANKLISSGRRVLVIEKSKGVGGRLATRRTEQATFDHGAQFLKIYDKSPAPSPLDLWFKKGNADYYVSPSGMTSWAKNLAANVTVHQGERVERIQESSGLVTLTTDLQKNYSAKKVYLTAPLPQALELLDHSGIIYAEDLRKIRFAKALVGLFEMDASSSSLDDFCYEQDINDTLFSVSNQQSKKVSKTSAFTVVMTPSFSEDRFADQEEEVLADITVQFKNFIQSKYPKRTPAISFQQLKKWRYSHPLKIYSEKYALAGTHDKVVLLGDAFAGAHIQGALTSALAVAQNEIKI